MKDLWIWLVVTAAVVAFVFFFSMGQKTPPVEQPQGPEPQGTQPARDPTQALVSIWPPGSCEDEFTGTGFFVSDKGHILTAAHVVGTKEVGQQVTVQWAPPVQQPQRFTAIVLHKKPEWDIALLEIQSEGKTFPWLMLGDSDPQHLRLGDEVTIAGFPKPETLGCNTPTLTKGQLTARRKKLEELDPELEVLQLNISPGIHLGSSGSPVLDATDKVIGILIRGVVELSVYFAVPINIAAETDALKLHESCHRIPLRSHLLISQTRSSAMGNPTRGGWVFGTQIAT